MSVSQSKPGDFLPANIQLRNNLEVTIVELTAEREIIIDRKPEDNPVITEREAQVLGALMLQPNTLLTPLEIFNPEQLEPFTALKYVRAAFRDLTHRHQFLNDHIVQEVDGKQAVFALATDVYEGVPRGVVYKKTVVSTPQISTEKSPLKVPTQKSLQPESTVTTTEISEKLEFFSAFERDKFLSVRDKAKKNLQILGPADVDGSYPHLNGLHSIDLLIANSVYHRMRGYPATMTEIWDDINQECPLKIYTKADFGKAWVDFISRRLLNNPVLSKRISVRFRENPQTGQKEAGLIWTPDTRSYGVK